MWFICIFSVLHEHLKKYISVVFKVKRMRYQEYKSKILSMAYLIIIA